MLKGELEKFLKHVQEFKSYDSERIKPYDIWDRDYAEIKKDWKKFIVGLEKLCRNSVK
jgi:hypothetical protein